MEIYTFLFHKYINLSDKDGKFSRLRDRRYVNEPFRLE